MSVVEFLPRLAVPAALEADRGRVHQESARREHAQEEQPRLQDGRGRGGIPRADGDHGMHFARIIVMSCIRRHS